MGMFQAMLIRGDLANRGELISSALSNSSHEGLVEFRWRIFSNFLSRRKKRYCTKVALLKGFSELLLLGGILSLDGPHTLAFHVLHSEKIHW